MPDLCSELFLLLKQRFVAYCSVRRQRWVCRGVLAAGAVVHEVQQHHCRCGLWVRVEDSNTLVCLWSSLCLLRALLFAGSFPP